MENKNDFRLVKPSKKYKDSFITGTKEFQQEKGRDDLGFKSYTAFVREMRDYENGRNLPKGHVRSSYYWLVDDLEFIGEITIRHKLTKGLLQEGGNIGYGIRPIKRKLGYGKIILALVLQKAKALGIKKALVTCNDDNIGSIKIIEANGGAFQDKIMHKGKIRRRYWIKI